MVCQSADKLVFLFSIAIKSTQVKFNLVIYWAHVPKKASSILAFTILVIFCHLSTNILK